MKLVWGILACMLVSCATASEYDYSDLEVEDRSYHTLYIYCRVPRFYNGYFKSSTGKTVRWFIKGGTEIFFHCREGYELDAPFNAECGPSNYRRGKLTYNRLSKPVCKPVNTCTRPKNLHNALTTRPKDQTTFKVGSTIWYSCADGYTLQGARDIKCIGSNKWATNPPTCVRNVCTKPKKLHPKITTKPKGQTTFGVGKKIWYMCPSGYKIVGAKDIECKGPEKWGAQPPTCVPLSCTRPNNLHKAIRTAPKGQTTFKIGSTIWYTCADGYTLKGDRDIKCVGSNEWEKDPPTCVLNSCTRPENLHKAISTRPKGQTTFNVGSTIWYRCDDGYTLEGDRDIRCVGPNKWEKDPPTCVSNTCTRPENLHKAISTRPKGQTTFNVGSTIWYRCADGFELRGDRDIKCVGPNKWKNDPPTCIPKICKIPTDLHANITTKPVGKTIFAVGEKIWYACPAGYGVIGYKDIECIAPNKWKFDPPTCVRNVCTKPIDLHPKITSKPKGQTTFEIGKKIWYMCPAGYKIVGAKDIECKGPEKWRYDPPTCVLDSCIRPDNLHPEIYTKPTNQVIFEIGKKIWYKCRVGYVLQGAADIQCKSAGKWKYDPPTCVPDGSVRCPALEKPQFGDFTPKQKDYFPGHEVTFSCKEGYEIDGEEKIECLKTGQWSAEEPSCEPSAPIKCPLPTINPGVLVRPIDEENDGYDVGTVIWLGCESLGYVIVGSKDRTCLPNGKWNGRDTYCVLPVDKKPIEHRSFNLDGYNYDDNNDDCDDYSYNC